MNRYSISIRWAGGILVLWLLISSCAVLSRTTRVGETRTETQTVELGSADKARVQIRIGAGELSIAGEANSLMDATFRYNVADWQPRINYTVNSSQGELVVDHKGEAIPISGALINEWSLQLNNSVPIYLDIETGAGKSELDLRGLDLTGLQIDIGAGTTNINLSSVLDHDLNATITGGVGEFSVKLPGDMGVQISLDRAIGNLTTTGLVRNGDYYVNDSYGSAPSTLFLDINAGIGSIKLLAP
jgi:hypothetical protein